MSASKHASISRFVTVCVAGLGLLGAAAVGVVSWRALAEMETALADDARVADAKMEMRLEQQEALALDIARQALLVPGVADLVASGNRDALAGLLRPVFDEARRRHPHLEQFQIAVNQRPTQGTVQGNGPWATMFLRMQAPTRFGDDVSGWRHMLSRALAAPCGAVTESFTGLEMSTSGVAMQAAVPICAGARAVGTLNVGLRFDRGFFEDMRRRDGGSYALYLPADVAEGRVAVEPTFRALLRMGQLTLDESRHRLVPVAATHPAGLSSAEALKAAFAGATTHFFTYMPDGAPVLVGLSPERNFVGEIIGVAEVAIDASAYVTTRNTAYAAIALIALLLFGATVAIWWNVRRRVAPLTVLATAVRRIGEGDLAADVPAPRVKDEIAAVAEGVAALRASLVEAERVRERGAAERKAEREAIENRLISSVGMVVEAAGRGDFTVKAKGADELGRLGVLVGGLNQVTGACQAFLDEADKSLGRLAGGDLTARMSEDFAGRLASVAANFNAAADALSRALEAVKSEAAATRHGATEISTATRDLSTRTESQAASLEETAAAIEEISKTVSETAVTVDRAAGNARRTAATAEAGAKVAGEAVAAIDRVDAQAKKIVEIVGVMDGLAFQTNLLALNASVEAARAGEAGRGFAVVANEVRRLAQQSAEAARDVRLLVAETNTHVGDGVKLVREAGRSLTAIATEVRDVAATFGEITVATREQSGGVTEVAKALAQMDGLTQANAQAAEETAAAAHQLVGTADKLGDLAASFRTDAPAGAAKPMRRAA